MFLACLYASSVTMKRSKSYRPGMTGCSLGLSMQQLEDTLHHHLEQPSYSYFEYEEPIMEDLESTMSFSSEEQAFSFTFSPIDSQTKRHQRKSSPSMSSAEDLLFDMELQSRPQSPNSVPGNDNVNLVSPSSQSQAIAIPVPSARRSDPSSFDVPPLSARGDLQGAYFPNHEDPNSRITATHPFQAQAEMARRNSLKQAAASARAKVPSTAEFGPDGKPKIPKGKYYPANWEKAHNQPPLPIPAELQPLVELPASPSTTAHHFPTSPRKSNAVNTMPQTPPPRGNYHRHNRTESEAKRLVHAYQREMVIQASMGIMAVANSKTQKPRGNISPARPRSPRLEPLGSPAGPVTPMSLEDDGGYLTLGQPMTVEIANLQTAEVTRALRADRARRQEQRHTRNKSSNSHIQQHHWSALSAGLGQMSF